MSQAQIVLGYGLPIALMLGLAAIALVLGAADVVMALAMLIGLFAGGRMAGWLTRRLSAKASVPI